MRRKGEREEEGEVEGRRCCGCRLGLSCADNRSLLAVLFFKSLYSFPNH